MKPWEAGSRCISHFYDQIPEVKARLLAPSFLQAMQGVPIIRSMFRPRLLPRNPRYQRCFEVATERQWLGVQCWRSAGSPGGTPLSGGSAVVGPAAACSSEKGSAEVRLLQHIHSSQLVQTSSVRKEIRIPESFPEADKCRPTSPHLCQLLRMGERRQKSHQTTLAMLMDSRGAARSRIPLHKVSVQDPELSSFSSIVRDHGVNRRGKDQSCPSWVSRRGESSCV